jgi:hypothetical protein
MPGDDRCTGESEWPPYLALTVPVPLYHSMDHGVSFWALLALAFELWKAILFGDIEWPFLPRYQIARLSDTR